MNIGKLDRQIVIQSPPTTKSSGGELTGDWSAVCTTWAKIRHNSSNEGVGEGTEQSSAAVSFIIRYRSGITSKMRILYKGDYYQISGVPKELFKNEYLELSGVHKTNW